MGQNDSAKKVLLVYPDFSNTERVKDHYGNYSEGLASISAVLKRGGHRVELYHLTYMPEKSEFQERIREAGADIVGFSVRTTIFSYVREMLAWTKESSGALTLCGGYHPTLAPEESILAENTDCICIGEGEYPLLELCDTLNDREKREKIKSLWFKHSDGSIVRNPVRPCIENLDDLPLPDYELFDYDRLGASRMKTALVMVSRGCIFSCTYCSNSQLRMVYPNSARYARFRSPENAINLIETVLRKYPYIKYLNFRDAILNMDKNWFSEFVKLYKERIHLPFTGNLRLDLMDEGVVRELAEAGCYMIDVGLESGDYKMRKTYLHRNMTDEVIINSFQWFRKYGITSMTYNIIGLPHENLKLALKTVKLNALIHPDRVIPNIFTPYPMTKLTEYAKEAGYLPDHPDFRRRVFLVQPQFPEQQVLFVDSYFSFFIKAYRRIWKMPKWIGAPLERFTDWYFATPFKPHRFLVAVAASRRRSIRWLKHILLRANPKLYLKLRDARVMQHPRSAG